MLFVKKYRHRHRQKRSLKKLSLIALALLLSAAIYGVTKPKFDKPDANHGQPTAETPKKQATQTVAVRVPKRLVIDKISVDANIVPVGLTEDGYMEDPDKSELVGWYNKSARLGEKKRAMLLDGHYGTRDNAAVFQRLSEVREGDIIKVFGDETPASYRVVETERKYTEEVDMKKAFYPYRNFEESLTIITCEGKFLPDEVTYDQRLIVYAVRI